MSNGRVIELNSGHRIPQLGFGTYKVADADAQQVVLSAFDAGYRHVDTAQMYGNERGVGEALAAMSLDRGDVFVTTKLNTPNHEPADVRRTFAQSLRDLRTDYVDLFLIHWPMPMFYDGDFVTTYRVMEEFVHAGTAKSIGVSNFETYHLDKLMAGTSIPPAVNQIELHPYFQNREVANYCMERGIAVESWSPLGRGGVLADPVIGEIAQETDATPAQVILAWHLAKGYIAIPKSSHADRQRENFAAADVSLTPEQIARIDDLDRGEEGRTGRHPDVFDRM
ncbi:aldo/keto reductase [Trueperella bialowiezensis]|uniref:2,5-diketo-D-gluconic acid reductase A n=1 Tax=Trueperella bialowiezensis TaxID=312285 RepID=A0A448PEH6_9ACTO|nr:aldo/keto reductase [Trueperella bialowiezensis]VEI13298.1 2,5-diketo-D-gluconic acid reductase A [Trueperella bialowiezensis]